MGLLGSSVSLSVKRSLPSIFVSGFSHRASTRQKARQMNVADSIEPSLEKCIQDSDLVILATPIRTFEGLFSEMKPYLKKGCIITDVGSTKTLPTQWAAKYFRKNLFYVGSHPIAGSEKRGVEFARDDLLTGATCIVTRKASTNAKALKTVKEFWTALGCRIEVISPQDHDRIFGWVSHLPHLTAAALVNANRDGDMHYAGRGFMDTSRVASGPTNVWTDILMTNPKQCAHGIGRLINELTKLQTAIEKGNGKQVKKLLEQARSKREAMIRHKIKKKELF